MSGIPNLHQKGSSRIDVVHEVVALHIGLECWRKWNRARIIDQDIDATKLKANMNNE